MDIEQVIMELIINSGDARSKAYEAINAAERGEEDVAQELMNQCIAGINKAHHAQTKLIQSEVNGETVEISLLLIHAQDHLMNSITVREFAEQMIKLHIKVNKLQGGE